MTTNTALTALKKLGLGLLLAGGAALASAQGHAGPMGAHGGHAGPGGLPGVRMEHLLDVVDASDAQRSQIKAIMDQARADVKAMHSSGQDLHGQMLTLFGATNIDAAAIEALRLQIQAQHEQVAKRMSQAMIDAARVLTPEQRAKFVALAKKRQARMAERAGGHGN
ncbi:Spy/CpxP family protein refolding chaperone [Paucibacter sp. APW11]|uniref:Spy/CpxP family protein refolding chaperone n=1 Tax=Roseateles aquae TaxID=3077235 RepID=A0ABU3P8N8_9BURK|nr:Spy/CpxP family protein refolding chaperone [Paucibacter sp. APW11]MDT8998928.1 Spy/CpxP family protein refolding chaperone [Paucibacter sp. APW11]